MNINGMVDAYMFVQFAGKKTADAPVFRENPAVTRPIAPVKKDDPALSTTVKTSDLGKATSSLDEVKTSVKALQEVSKINNVADAKKAAAGFVAAFNKQQAMASKNLSDKNLASAVQEPQQAMLEKSSKELDALGISTKADGSLALDESKLEAAFSSKKGDTLINLGRVGAASAEMVRSQEKGLKAAAAPASSPSSTASTQDKRLQEQQDAIKQLQAMNSGSSGSDTYRSIYQLFG